MPISHLLRRSARKGAFIMSSKTLLELMGKGHTRLSASVSSEIDKGKCHGHLSYLVLLDALEVVVQT